MSKNKDALIIDNSKLILLDLHYNSLVCNKKSLFLFLCALSNF
ncbi:hypothetical protein AAJ76_310001402 [Vairimorpha ceranae]|uniref:Uncharacterized protein n=1 Tax=Vairimorpha ceranae TaxID=40302 RepID=A0A0F9YRB7_9MICR|nr:hypothetical protein AAJ76_310001402 [Vairimorpha ceranae]KKO75122.1 hypothetical protein AAJ76_310001402 [Vairimorpha ceranae]